MPPDNTLLDRHVKPEWLDVLPPQDPAAVRSRADLRKINFFMGHAGTMTRLLAAGTREGPAHIIDLGGGDGRFLLQVARRLGVGWAGTSAVVVDRHAILSPVVVTSFADIGWTVWQETAEIGDPATLKSLGPADFVLANLFLHHFADAELRVVLGQISRATACLVAVEPRRSGLAALGCRLLPLIGCHPVTRHDAAVSVEAGFNRDELTQAWRSVVDEEGWTIDERAAGPFSHAFLARSVDRGPHWRRSDV